MQETMSNCRKINKSQKIKEIFIVEHSNPIQMKLISRVNLRKEIIRSIMKYITTIRTNNKISLRMYFFVIEIFHLIKSSFKWMIVSKCLKKLVKKVHLKFSSQKPYSLIVKMDKKIRISRMLTHHKKNMDKSKQRVMLMAPNFRDIIQIKNNPLIEKQFQKCHKGHQYIENWTRSKQKLKV